MKNTFNVFLIGFSGSGKSTVGPMLAGRLRAAFIDTDSRIEKKCGMSVTELFLRQGEKSFREMESQIMRQIAEQFRKDPAPHVVALGGGAFQSAHNRRLIQDSGLVVHLQCSVREIYKRMRFAQDRPLLQATPGRGETRRQAAIRRITTLLNRRIPNYHRADFTVSTTAKTPHEVASIIVQKLRRRYADR